MTTTNTKSDVKDTNIDTNKSKNGILTLLIMSVLFTIPMALWYSMIYSHGGGFLNSLLLFAGIYGLGLLAITLYYRIVISPKNKDKSTFGHMTTTLISFMVLLVTMLILMINPSLVSIFENTIGIWFVGLMGNSGFISEIFQSNIFSKLDEETDDNIFNKNFLLTRFSLENIDHFVKFFQKSCDGQTHDTSNVELPFDFKPIFENVGQLNKLRDLVSLKRSIGYFSWIYFTSIISLIMGMIAVTMQ